MATAPNAQYKGQYRNYLDNPTGFFADVDKNLEAFRAGRSEAKNQGLANLQQKGDILRAEGYDPSTLSEFQKYQSAFGGGNVPINPATGGLQFAPLAPVPDTGTIGGFNTQPESDLSKQISFYNSSQPFNLGSLNLGTTDTTSMTPEERSLQNQSDLAQRLNLELLGRSSFESQQKQSQDIAGKTKTVNDFTSQLLQLKAEQAAIQAQSAQPNETAAMLGAKQAEQNRQVAVKGLLVSAQLEAARGNLQLALDTVDRLVSEKYKPFEEARDVLKANIELFKNSPGYERVKNKIKKEEDKETESKRITSSIITDYLNDPEFQDNAPASVKKQLTDMALRKDLTQTDLINAANLAGQFKNVPKVGTEVLLGENPQLYSGLSSPTATAVRGRVSQFKTEPIVQNFATIQEGFNFASSLSDTTTNPADDQGLIYSLAKALDPGSVVREGEYATAQKYSQSWIKAYGKSITQALAGTGFLSTQARKNIKDTIESKYNASKTSYGNLYSQYSTGIDRLTGKGNGKDFLIDYAIQNVEQGTTTDNLPPVDSARNDNTGFFGNILNMLR